MANSDPHHAIAVDRLHVSQGGNESDHLLPETQQLVEDLRRDAIRKVDAQYVCYYITV